MTRLSLSRTLLAIGLFLFVGPSVDPSSTARLTDEQRSLVTFATGRFEAQGLALPEVRFVFHDNLFPCDGHKGLYFESSRTIVTSRTIVMCSMDERTMLHELAHAWASRNLTDGDLVAFVEQRGLDSWNDHDDPWERRGTEHVAETLAWALHDEPGHVKWVEMGPDGEQAITYRILTLGIDVETLSENFRALTGRDPMFRHPGEWTQDDAANEFSPEAAKPGA
jgi:hypothetical protein